MAADAVTLALGLRSAAQSLGVVGRELGVFAAEGLELRIVREETAGPEGVRGLVCGEYQFAEFGAVPVVQAALEGSDPLILLAAEQVSALYLLGGRHAAAPPALAGGTIGVLSESGQTGYSAQRMLERWGLARVTLKPLATYPNIYRALAAGEIHAGVLTADYKIAGAAKYGFSELADLGREFAFQGPLLATTRRFCANQPDIVRRVVRGYVRALRLFKKGAAGVVSALQRHLRFVDLEQAAAIQRFYAGRFQDPPYASDEGIARIIRSFSGRYPAASHLEPGQVHDASFLRAVLERG